MKILVTGFKPFLNDTINPSELLSKQLADKFTEVQSLILPVEFGHSFNVLSEYLKSESVECLIMLGQASGRSHICFEKIALNWVQTKHADEAKVLPLTGSINSHQPLALMSKFSIDELCNELIEKKYPVEISFSAGTFVCNDLYFRTLSTFDELQCIFIHVPLIQEQISKTKVNNYMEYQLSFLVMSEVINWILEKK